MHGMDATITLKRAKLLAKTASLSQPDELDGLANAIIELAEDAIACWPRPIPVSERLPSEQGDYLCFARKQRGSYQIWRMGFFIPDSGWEDAVSGYSLRDVTHWLPLPPKPE